MILRAPATGRQSRFFCLGAASGKAGGRPNADVHAGMGFGEIYDAFFAEFLASHHGEPILLRKALAVRAVHWPDGYNVARFGQPTSRHPQDDFVERRAALRRKRFPFPDRFGWLDLQRGRIAGGIAVHQLQFQLHGSRLAGNGQTRRVSA